MISRNIRKSVKYIFAALLCCLVMSVTMVCLADEKGTVTVDTAKIRSQADASSDQLASVAKGGTVDIIGQTTGADGKTWYQVYVDANTKGYIRSDLVSVSGSASLPNVSSSSGAGTTTNASEAPAVTPIEPKVGTVKSNSVNVRKGTSTNSASIATVRSGVVLTVTGEATGSDGQKWYQVTFKHNDKDIEGFIRSDLVTFDNVPADAAISSEITGSENPEGAGETQPQEAEPEPPKQEDTSATDDNAGVIFMNVEETPYVLPGFEPVTLDWNNQKISAYRNGTFFIVYAQKQNGDEGWYLLDREMNVYQRYPYTVENVTAPEAGVLSGSPVLLIGMAVVIIIMLIIIAFLLVRLRGNDGYYEDYEDDDDYSDEDDEIEEFEEAPIRRPAPKKQSPQPSQRPASQEGQQPARRPAPQGGTPQGQNGQPVRRPAPQNGASQGQNGQPVRRPAPQGGASQGPGGQPVRRPAPQNGAPQGQKRPTPQNNRPAQNVAPQKGQKAKAFLDNDDDDMDFIDI